MAEIPSINIQTSMSNILYDSVTNPTGYKVYDRPLVVSFNPFRAKITLGPLDYSDLIQVTKDVMGGIDMAPDPPEANLPVKWDEQVLADGKFAVADKLSYRQLGNLTDTTGNSAKPEKILVDVEFAVPTWSEETDGDGRVYILTERWDRWSKFFQKSNEGLSWSPPGEPAEPVSKDDAPSIVEHGSVWQITLHYVTNDEWNAVHGFQTWVGSSNSRDHLSPVTNVEFEIETLAFDKPDVVDVETAYGTHKEVTFNLMWRQPGGTGVSGTRPNLRRIPGMPWGWNVYPKQGTNDYFPMYLAGADPRSEEKYFRQFPVKDWQNYIPLKDAIG
jgi:hypothetical protein